MSLDMTAGPTSHHFTIVEFGRCCALLVYIFLIFFGRSISLAFMSLYSEFAALHFKIVAVVDMCAKVTLLAGDLTRPLLF